MFFHQRFIPGLAIASYIIGDEKAKQAAIIDPTRDVDAYLDITRAEGLKITAILETHVHADFVSGAAQLKARLLAQGQTGFSVYASAGGGSQWNPPYADVRVNDGDQISLGSIRLKALHTPGHTPEHIAWLLFDDARSREVPWIMFSGDFVFVGDVGRPDLLGDEARKQLAHDLYRSIFTHLPAVPDFTEIFPAHGAGSLCGKAIGSRRSSTLGFERRFNPSLRELPEPAWIDHLLSGMPLAPPYFRHMKKINAAGPRILTGEWWDKKQLTVKDLQQCQRENCLILDLRPKEAFSAAHIPGSLSIPLAPTLPVWAGWVIPPDQKLAVVLAGGSDRQEVQTLLSRVGYDDIAGFLEDGVESWETQGLELGSLDSLSVHALARRLKSSSSDRPFVLDVRTDTEWQNGHIEGATHIHAGLLTQHLDQVPKDKEVAVMCGTGYRASVAASLLKNRGYPQVADVLGGMTAWKAANLPIIQK